MGRVRQSALPYGGDDGGFRDLARQDPDAARKVAFIRVEPQRGEVVEDALFPRLAIDCGVKLDDDDPDAVERDTVEDLDLPALDIGGDDGGAKFRDQVGQRPWIEGHHPVIGARVRLHA